MLILISIRNQQSSGLLRGSRNGGRGRPEQWISDLLDIKGFGRSKFSKSSQIGFWNTESLGSKADLKGPGTDSFLVFPRRNWKLMFLARIRPKPVSGRIRISVRKWGGRGVIWRSTNEQKKKWFPGVEGFVESSCQHRHVFHST